MGIAVLLWQAFIFFTLVVSGRKRGWVAAFWVIWTLAQVFALPLSLLQFFTIWLGYTVAKPKVRYS
jgi:DNA helicase-4